MEDMDKIIDEQKIERLLNDSKFSTELFDRVLAKALKMKGLNLSEVAVLINAPKDQTEKIFEVARKIKREIYGERIVLFAPLYISNYCVNDCEYCGFHIRNKMPRRKLTLEEIKAQTEILIQMGHKRLLLEFGEHQEENPIDYVVDTIKTIYSTKVKNGEIRRVNVNIAATTVENYKKLKAAGIGTYQLFQETYHRESYAKFHHGPKADYDRQIGAHIRAFQGGIDDLGMGALFGLYDWKFELLALLTHAHYLEKKCGVGPHTISVPRFQPASSVDFQPPFPVSGADILKIIATVRLALPYTGIIISTRESAETRLAAFEIGASQTSAASCVEVGGYKTGQKHEEHISGQFNVQDDRPLDQVVAGICKEGLLPSFCTACYRKGRTGEKFMELAKPGEIHNFCRPNAILTFQEYLYDYASPETKLLGGKIIAKYLEKIESRKIYEETLVKLSQIKAGERDLYF